MGANEKWWEREGFVLPYLRLPDVGKKRPKLKHQLYTPPAVCA